MRPPGSIPSLSDRKSTRLNSSHSQISYAVFCLKKKRCLDELRRKRVIHFSELESVNDDEELSPLAAIPDNGPLPEELAEQSDLQYRLQDSIETLPIKFRSVVLLRYAGQLSFSEIGQTLNMPEATAKTYFQRAKPLLRPFPINQDQLVAH